MKITQRLGILTNPDQDKLGRVFFYVWAVLLLIGGAVYWIFLLDQGNNSSFLLHDWHDITYPRLSSVQAALQQGVLPLHTADRFALQGITNRFLTFPDLLLSPQVILLIWMDIIPFIVVNLLLSYLIGGAGLVYLSRKLKFSPLAFTFLFLFFNFNGHIIAHISVGHLTWTAYYFLPWFFVLILQLYDHAKVGWIWVASVAMLSVIILLQGGYHQFIWCLMFLGLMMVALPHHFWRILQAGLFSTLLNAFRLVPLILNLGKFDNRYLTGYSSSLSVWEALTVRYLPPNQLPTADMNSHYGVWEYTLYIGLAGALFLVAFGIIASVYHTSRIRNKSVLITDSTGPDPYTKYISLLVPAIGMAVLSLEDVFKHVRNVFPLPFFAGERIVTRMVILAFLVILLLAVIEFQRMLNSQQFSIQMLAAWIGVVILIVHDMYQNARFWQLSYAVNVFGENFHEQQVQNVIQVIDPVYSNMLWVGLALSLVAFGVLVYKILSNRSALQKGTHPNTVSLG